MPPGQEIQMRLRLMLVVTIPILKTLCIHKATIYRGQQQNMLRSVLTKAPDSLLYIRVCDSLFFDS